MRIAIVSLHTSPLETPGHGDAGGMNVVVAESAAALARLGHRVEIFTRAVAPGEIGSVRLPTGVTVHRLIAGPEAPVAKNDLVGLLDSFAVSMADFGPYDVVHSHYWLSALAVLRSGWTAPHVHTFHTTARAKSQAVSAAEACDVDVRAAAEQQICDAVSLLCCVSDSDAATLQQLYQVEAERVVVVRPAVDSTLFRRRGARVRRQWRMLQRVPSDAFVIATAGRIQPLKGQAFFAEAFSLIDRRLPVCGVVIGDPTPGHEAYYAALTERIQQPDLAGRFALRSAVSREQLALWFAVSQLAVVPSASESFGLTSLEAQSAGVPVVARDVGGLPETLVDGVTGVLIDSDDPARWASVIVDFAQNVSLRASFARAAHTFAREYSWEAVGERLTHFYASLD